jgi:ATP-dependent helicase/nuclease subunit A
MVNWTPEQKKAIELRNHNILVSAAAGSGKTAVLVERIKQLIINDKVGLDKFLIVTFTKAAASEMKEKLLKAITKEIRENPENSAFLRKQLDVMANANISTSPLS